MATFTPLILLQLEILRSMSMACKIVSILGKMIGYDYDPLVIKVINLYNEPVMQQNFGIYHPVINLIYFVAVILMSVLIMNPIFLCVSLICSSLYAVYLKGRQAVKFGLAMVLPLLTLSVIINPFVNHRGATILFEWPLNWGPATLEAVLYGFTTGLMISSVIMWFVSFNTIITSDKLTFLFGRILPGSSLIFVMILRFIPRYRDQIKKISEARQSIGMGVNKGTLRTKLKNGTGILSIMFTWALENAIQTADSMKARGYGIKNRTSYQAYKFTFSDKVVLIFMVILILGVCSAWASGFMGTEFFPFFELTFNTGTHAALIIFISGCLCFALMALIPILLGLKETLYWNKIDKEEGDF